MKNLLITGRRGAGKSTLLREILRRLPGRTGGLESYCERDAEYNRVFLRALGASSGKLAAVLNTRTKRCVQYDETVFSDYAVSVLEDCKDCDNILIDEIGFLERDAAPYLDAVRGALDSRRFVVAALRDAPGEPFIQELLSRQDVLLARLSPGETPDAGALLRECGVFGQGEGGFTMQGDERRIAGIVMASGFSRRMGKDKLMMPFQGKPLVAHVLQAIEKAGVLSKVYVVAVNPDVLNLAEQYHCVPLLNRENMIGQSASIRRGVLAAEDATHYMFFAGDQPLLSPKLIRDIAEKADKRRIVVATHDGREGLPSLFPAMYRDALLNVHGDHGGRKVKDSYRGYILPVPATAEDMLDIDDTGDYQNLIDKY